MTWMNTVIGDLVEPKVDQGGPSNAEFTYVDISSIDNATKRVADPKQLSREKAPSRARQRLEARDVVVSMTRPNLNAVALLPPELDGAIGSTGFDVLRAKSGVEPAWLYYAVQTPAFIHAMSGVVQGALYPAVRPKDIRGFPLVVPPLDEQHRIVAEIEEQLSRLEAGVAALKRVQANLKRYRASVLSDLCKSNCGQLPPGWVRKTLGELAAVVRGGSPRPAGDPRYFGGPIPWITVGPITASIGKYLTSVPEGVNEAGKARSRYITAGTLLLTNSGATLGVPKITTIDGCINDGVAALLNVDEPLKSYLLHFLASQTDRLRGTNQGAAQPNLNTTIIKAISVPLPPRDQMAHIVAEIERRLSVVEELETQVRADLARAERLRQACLSKAFQV